MIIPDLDPVEGWHTMISLPISNKPYMEDAPMLRELASQYREMALSRRQRELRELWRAHNSLAKTRIPVVCSWDEGSNLAGELLAGTLRCSDPELRGYELFMRNSLYHAEMEDDWTYEPFLTVQSERKHPDFENGYGLWGQKVKQKRIGQAFITVPTVRSIEDIGRLTVYDHEVDEAATTRRMEKFTDVFGDSIDLCLSRRPLYHRLGGCDLSTAMAELLGLENMMVDMALDPELVHATAAWLRDATLKQFRQAEDNGDFTPHGGWWENEGTPYCDDLPDPSPLAGIHSAKKLWGFMAAQEFTLISPAMHKEFLFDYQKPIMEYFGLISYGCCENLTEKIEMLRDIPNLRRIGITLAANVKRCAEQIGESYVFAWRPNPSVVAAFFDRSVIRKQLREGLEASRGCRVDIMLKDVSTVQGEPERLFEWVNIARETAALFD